jgi:hypothetical protein
MRIIAFVPLGFIAVTSGLLAACGARTDLERFDPEEDRSQEGFISRIAEETDVIIQPDGFPNVAAFCYDGDRIYTTTRAAGDNMEIIPNGCEVR